VEQKGVDHVHAKWSLQWLLMIVPCLILPCLSAPLILPALSLSSKLEAFNLSNLDASEPYECFEGRLFHSRRAKIGDCARALAALLNYHSTATFINGTGDPDMNPYLLPYTTVYHGCQIKVELVYGDIEESSWLSINIATTKVMNACLVGYSQDAETGGMTRVVCDNRMRITIEKTQAVGLSAGDDRNDTSQA